MQNPAWVRLNKTQMARCIVQALYNRDRPPPADHGEVQMIAKRDRETVIRQFEMAEKAVASVGKHFDLKDLT